MKTAYLLAGAVLLLAGCVSAPTGPNVMVLPGSSKSFDQFRVDDQECRQYAQSSVGGGSPNSVATDSGVKSAAIGTAVGAAAGALAGGNSAAGPGAGIGLVVGALAGSSAANESSHTLQQRYDYGYQQCMYARGNKIPMAPQTAQRERYGRSPGPYYAPPPPPPAPR
ncbi:MAG TPA: hypothetical protein VF943_15845 [Burkholderiales bacterium]